MRTAKTVLTVIQERGKKRKPLERIYKLLFNRELYLNAYMKLYPNNVIVTKNAAEKAVDTVLIGKIDRIIEYIREEKYRWKPLRQEKRTKKNETKHLSGIPSWRDRLLQEVIREILEAYYEPQFSRYSFGFRPTNRYYTALQEVKSWTGTRWLIEGDISSSLNTIDHSILLKILEKSIHDNRFIRLVSEMLKTGCLENWKFNPSLSGTPQGGLISPLLSNIYLNEFDQWIEKTLIPETTRGKRQKVNPTYSWTSTEINAARKNSDTQSIWIPPVAACDTAYRRCQYVRYASSFLIGFVGTKADAEIIKARLLDYLNQELNLKVTEGMALVTNAGVQSARFLGYEIKAQRRNAFLTSNRHSGAILSLRIPAKVIEEKCRLFMRNGKVTHQNLLLHYDDSSIIQWFQKEYCELVQHYALAQNLSWLSKVHWVMETALLKTLACKHRSSMNQQKARYQRAAGTSGMPTVCN